MSSILPMRRKLNEAMLLAVIVSRSACGRKALSAKMVIAVGWPINEPRGVLYCHCRFSPRTYWAKIVKLSVSS